MRPYPATLLPALVLVAIVPLPPSRSTDVPNRAKLNSAGPGSSPGARAESSPGLPTEYVTAPPATIYTDSLPAGVVRMVRYTSHELRDGRYFVTTYLTYYRRRERPLPPCWIDIPALGIRHRIVEGVRQRDMAFGPGHFPGMALPGETGNCAIAAHSNVPGCAYFHSLHRIRPGMHIYIHTPEATYRYTVVNEHLVRPTNVSDLRATDYPRLTLVTCELSDARYRLIVVARGDDFVARRTTQPQAAGAGLPVAGVPSTH